MRGNSDLIQSLKEDLKPVRPYRSPLRWAVAGFATTVVLAGLGLFAMPIRPDLAQRISKFSFLLNVIWLLLGAIFVALAVSWIGRPGRPGQRALIGAAFGSIACFALLLVYQALTVSPSSHGAICDLGGAHCAMGVVMLSVAPGVFLFLKARKSAPVYPGLSGLLIGLGVGVVASAALSFSCRDDEAFHLLSWHLVLPLLMLGAAGGWMGRKYLRW